MELWEGPLPKGIYHVIPSHNEWINGKIFRSRDYLSWKTMIYRCYYPRAINYDIYGGDGVRVCKRWVIGDGIKSGFMCFLEDMGFRPVNTSINRKSKHYIPEKCEWADIRKQNRERRLQKSNTTGCRGVSLIKISNRFRSNISVNNININLGTFTTIEEAARAYDAAAVKYFGSSAQLNNV